MANIPFPSTDMDSPRARTEPALPVESLNLATADIAARTGSTHVLEEILSHAQDPIDNHHYLDHWGINE